MVVPLAAVTTTVSVLFPVTKFDLPEITVVASMSAVFATTFTLPVSGASSKVPPSTTAVPFTVNSARLVFELNGATTAFNKIVLVVFRSPAVTIT